MKIKSMSRTDPNKRGGTLYEASRNLTEYNQQLRSRGASGNIPASTSPTVSVPKAGTAPAGTRIQSDYEAAQRANARRNYEYRQTTGQLPSQSGENQELSHRRDVVRDRQANYLQTGGTVGSAQNQVFQRSIDAIDAEIAGRQNDRQKEAQTRAKNTADALKYNQKTFEKRAKEAKKQYGEGSDEYRAAQQRADEATKAVWEAGLPWQMRVANYADAVGGRLVGTAPQLAATLTRPPENEIRDNEFSRRYQAMNNWLQSAADYFYDVSAQGNAALKYGLGKVGSTVADVAVAGGEMLSDAAMNMILPGSGVAAMGLRAGASGANEAYHAGATPGQEFMYGAATAGVEMLTEKMFDGMAKVYGAGAADEITEGIVRRLAETNSGRTLARMLINTPGEGIEEVVSDLANPFIKYIYDNGAALQESYGTGEGFKSMMQEAGYDFLVGAILGVGGAAASVTNGESAARNARLALQDDFIAQMSTGDGSSFFIEPHSGQTTRFGVEQYGDTWWGYAIDGQGKTYWQNGYKSRSAAERGTAVAASDWIVEQAANPENRANDADVRARDEQRAETAAENPGSTIADDQAVEIQKTLQDSGAKNSSLAQAVKLSGIVDKILNGDTSLSNNAIRDLDLYHNKGLLSIVEQKTGEKIDTSSNKRIVADVRAIVERRAELYAIEDEQKTAQAAAATQAETQILPQIEQEAATDVQETVLADEAQEPAVQTEMPVVNSIPDNTEKPGQASARTKSPILSKAEMDAYNAGREERLEKARQKGAEKRARVKKEKEESARRESTGKQAEETAESQPIINNKSVAIPNGNGYTEEKQSGYSYLSDRLERGYDRVEADGLRYFITRTSDGYRVNIDRVNGSDGYVTDARSHIYKGGPFATRENAVDDLLGVALKNFYPEEQWAKEDREDIDGNAIRAELERRRASGESPVDNMLRQAQEIADQQFGTKEGYNEQERTRRDGNASEETKQNGARSRTLQETSEGILRQDAVLRGARERLSPDFGQSPIRTWADGHIVVPVEGSVAYQEQQMTMGYGVPSFVVDDAVWGKNEGAVQSFSVNGQIYFKETIPEKLRGMLAPHELTHVMKQMDYQPYMDFVKRTAGMLDMTSDEAQVLLEAPAKHRKIDVFGADQKLDMGKIKVLSEADALKLYDELNATLYGHIGSGKLDGLNKYLDKAFYDFNAYATELKSIHDRFREAQAKATVAQIPQQKIADEVRKLIEDGIAFTNTRLFEIANKAYGGTMAQGAYTVKDAYDGMELAVNQYLLQSDIVKEGNGDAETAKKTLAKLQALLRKLPTQTKRTAEMESYQQFSTPPNIAYLAAWTANVNSNDVVLEPSAGIGGLALWPKAWGATVYGNELSERRLAFLNQLGLDGTFNLNAEQINNLLPDEIKPTTIIMNPPFSSTAGRTATNKTANAKRHIEQALDRLEDGGRLVAILGNGMEDSAPAFRAWWNDLRREYSVRANIRIDGENYKKYGTTFDVQLVVIDKTGPNKTPTITGTYKDISEIPDLMEGIRNDRTREAGTRDILHDGNLGDGRNARSDGELIQQQRSASRNSPSVRGRGQLNRNDGPSDAAWSRSGSPSVREHGGKQGVSGTVESRRGDDAQNGDALQRVGERGDLGREGRSDAEIRMALSTDFGGDTGRRTSVSAENPDSVYSTYSPSKVHIKGAKKHPAKLVESAAMGAVLPPDPTYTPALPARIAREGILSDAQIENVVYAGQAHSQTLPDGRRMGYFIGDGTGVGKGRQLAGIIMDNRLQGRTKAVWLSASPELINDARRDWIALGGNKDDILDMRDTKLIKTGIQTDSGILFGAYSTISHNKNKDARFKMLRDWLGEDFDGVIAFDEAHKMGNSVPTKKKRGKSKPSATAITGIELQRAFPNARVVYASATGATKIADYGYLDRLGLWGKGTAFNDVNDFISKISDGGLAAMEIVARDMKAMGVYMARSISYDDVKYDTVQHDLTPMQTEIYNTMSRAWQKVLQNMNKALEITGQSKDGKARGNALGMFYSSQQRFYDQVLTSMSMPSVIEDMRRELAAGRSCVLQLVNTNAAQADRALAKNEAAGGSLDDLDLTPSDTLIQMLEKSFPVELYEEYTDEDGRQRSRPVPHKDGKPVLDKKAVQMRDNLIAEIQQMKVPDGPLEMLLDAFGTDNVAEVTGRTRRVVEKPDENGNMKRVVESRSPVSSTAEAKAFQDGKKRILVFSKQGGTGFSYHADLRAKNQQQRVHYLLQPGWSASEAVQGFGRTHRSNQASAPIFRLVTTNVMGQKRFTSTIARRLDQLGALTKGQRQASGGVFGEKDNLENPIAMDALATFYKSADKEVLKKLGLYDNLFDEWGRINESSSELRDISKFLNRILSLEVDEQNATFQQFYDTFERMMDAAIANGTVDMGLENFRADKVEVLDETVIRKDPSGADTRYVQMKVYRKPEIIPFSSLENSDRNFKGLVRLEDGSVRAVYEISSKTTDKGEVQRRFSLESPVRGTRSVYVEKTLKEKTTKINKNEWARAWKSEIEKAPEYSETTLHLLTGTLLPIWNRLPANNTRVMRVVTSDGKQYLGRVIRSDQIDGVLRSFGTNRTMQTYTPEQLSDLVLKQGKEISLRDNRVKIMRRRVSGEWRMEITGNNIWYIAKQHPGVFSERINYDYRYFIPTGETGTDVLSDITKDNPVVDVREAAPSENVDANLIGYSRDAKGEWSAERIKGGDEKEKAKSLSEIVEQIRHDFGVNITTGHIRGKRGQYDRSTSGIRSKLVNDLPNIVHELGHHLDNLFDLRGNLSAIMRDELENGLDDAARKSYPKKKWVSEGIAEYFRKYLQNRETAAIDYPEFTAHLKNLLPARDAAQLDQLADEVNAYYSLDADTATSSVRLRKEGRPDARTLGEKIRDKADVLYQAWTDSNHGIKLFDEETGADTYKLATNAAYSDAIAGQVIIGDLTDANGKYISGGLTAALHGINLKDKEAYRLFGEYLIVRHGPERFAEGMRIFADDRKNSKEFMDRRAMELEQQHPEFKEAADRLYQFQRDCRQAWLVDTGLISADTAEQWDERWQYYVPLNRAVSMKARGIGAKRGFANQKSPIKKARGSGLDIIHPVDNIINNIVLMVNAGVRNNVMRKITDEAGRLGADASLLEHVPTPMKREQFRAADLKEALKDTVDNSEMTAEDKMFMLDTIGNISDVLEQFSRGKAYGDVITVMKEGKPEFWKVNDPLLLESITSMSPARQAGVLDVFARVSRFMTANITGRNLVWNIFSNLPRDIMTFAAYSKEKNPWRGLTSVASAWGNRFKKPDKQSALYKEFLALGGGRVSAYTSDKNIAESARKHIARGGRVEWWNPLEIIDFVADTVENGPRFATYKMMRENGLTEQEAFYEAMDITVNFRRGGRLSRDVNKIVPFFNAGVQGLDKFRRWISAADAPSSYREKTIVKRVGMYITASIISAAIEYAINHRNDDDEMYYHQLSAYTKHSYWCIPMGDGKFFCIPKPRELGVPASFFADVLNRAVDGDPYAFNAFYEYAANAFLPSVASDVAQLDLYGAIGNLGLIGVVAYMAANRDFLGRPIESTAMRNLLPEDRFTEKTAITSKWLGRAFSKIPGASDALKSPAMWDYFLSNTLGGFQKANKALFPVGSENRDWSLGVKNTWVKDARYSTDLVNWMYDRAEASSQEKRSNPDDPAIAVRAKMDDNLKSFYSSYYALAKNEKETEESTSARQTVLNVISEYRLAADYESPSGAEEVVRGVAERLDDTSLLPGVMNTYVKNRKGEKITLSAPDYVRYQMDYLRIYWEGVERLANRNMSDSRLAESIQKAKTTAKNVATGNALSRIGEKSSVW